MPDIEFPTDFPAYTPPLTGTRQVMLDGQESATVDNLAIYTGLRVGATFVWRPVAGPPPAAVGVVYADIVALLAAVAATQGVVEIMLDATGGGVFEIPAGVYPFACREIVFWGNKGFETLIFLDGVSFTGVTSFRFRTCTVNWRGQTSPLCSATAGVGVDGPVTMNTTGATAPMFRYATAGGLLLNGPLNAISTTSYELFQIDVALYTFPGFNTTIGTNVFRGAGSLAVFLNGTDGAQINSVQTNLAGGISTVDTSDGLLDRNKKLPLLTGSSGSLYNGDGTPNDEAGFRNLTVISDQYGSDTSKALQFAFTGSQGYSSTDAWFSITGDMTIEAICTGFNTAASNHILLTQGGDGAAFDRRFFLHFWNKQLHWGFDDGTVEQFAASRIIYPHGRFILHCVRTVGANTNLQLWVNGRQVAAGFFPGVVPDNTGPDELYFGQSATGTSYLGSSGNPSMVSQMYVDNVAWSPSTIQARARRAGLFY